MAGSTEFSIVRGGPLYRLSERLGIGRKPQTRAAVISLIAWGPLLVLSLIEGTATGGRGALLDDAQVWVRCLFALPCLLLAESLVDDRIGQAMSSLLRSTLLGPAQRPAFEAARLRLQQGLDLWWVEATMIVIAVAGARSGVFAARVPNVETWRVIGAHGGSGGTAHLSWAATWYVLVAAPLFTVLFMRWLWRLGLWTLFLLRLARAPLPLVPAHPDRAGGLEVLSAAHNSFAPVVLAVSAVIGAGIVNHTRLQGGSVMEYQYVMIAVVLALPALFLAPLLVFTPWLASARRRFLHGYSVTASRMGALWQRHWMDRVDTITDADLGSQELQAFSDFGNTYDHTSETRIAPITSSTAVILLVSAALPMLAVVATERPVTEVLRTVRGFM